MTYHRTAGKGGTRNSRAERDPVHPNFNKSTTGGETRKPRTGRRLPNNARNPAPQGGSGSGQNNPGSHKGSRGGY